MAVGRIAREFNLYTKITGSQRGDVWRTERRSAGDLASAD